MKFTQAPLAGAWVIDLEPVADERGSFARTWCAREMEAHGLTTKVAQCSVSRNTRKATHRGMHYQAAPHEETKVVRCTRGAIFDVIVDLATKQWFGIELTPENERMLLVPEGVAHGFQTLADATEVSYLISRAHHPQSADGVRWNDPAFAIAWPLEPTVMSERDRNWRNHAD